MKKIMSVFLSILLIVLCGLSVSAEEISVNEKRIADISFGQMYYDESKELNQVWFELKINGDYVNVDRFIVHFSVDKSILIENNMYAGDDTLDYFANWEETDVGYNLIISSKEKSDFSDFVYRSGFKMLKTGVHNLTATIEIIYKNGTIEKSAINLVRLRNEVIDISEVEFVYINKENLNMHPVVAIAYTEYGTTVGDFLDIADIKNAVVMLRDGAILDSDEVIPADAFLATMFGMDVIDSIGIAFFGDIDNNGKITATDARLALRYSAQLINLADIAYHAADVDGKAGVNAADARLILRKAAQLD